MPRCPHSTPRSLPFDAEHGHVTVPSKVLSWVVPPPSSVIRHPTPPPPTRAPGGLAGRGESTQGLRQGTHQNPLASAVPTLPLPGQSVSATPRPGVVPSASESMSQVDFSHTGDRVGMPHFLIRRTSATLTTRWMQYRGRSPAPGNRVSAGGL